ncbi:hypothetical protein BGW37DRAFT_560575 [Umbelopsis sp. PMI_123]|nr:hypothetical protein BGW37DRAFT_560575 [Umbelopsis sp. PMI_123]
MSTSPELRVTTLQVSNVPPFSPLNTSKATPATGSLTPKRRKLPLKTVLDPSESPWQEDIENRNGGSENVVFSATKKHPLSIGTSERNKYATTSRRDTRRPTQTLVARLGAVVSSPNFDISKHSILPGLTQPAQRKTPLTPRSEARRVRFLDMEQQSSQEEFMQVLFPDSTEPSSPNISDDEEVKNEEQDNPFEVLNDDKGEVEAVVPKPESIKHEEPQHTEVTQNVQSSPLTNSKNSTKSPYDKLLYVDVSDDDVSDGEDKSGLPGDAKVINRGPNEGPDHCNRDIPLDDKVEQTELSSEEQQNERDNKDHEQPPVELKVVVDVTHHESEASSDSNSSTSEASDSEDMESGLMALWKDRENSLAGQPKVAEQILSDEQQVDKTVISTTKIISPIISGHMKQPLSPIKATSVKKTVAYKKHASPLSAYPQNQFVASKNFVSHNKSVATLKPTQRHKPPYSLPSAIWEVNVRRDKDSGSSKENVGWPDHPRNRKSRLRKQRNASTQWVVGDLSAEGRQCSKLPSKRRRETSLPRQLR